MNFFDRIKNGFAIVGISFDVIKKNREIWFYPMLSISLWLVVLAVASLITFGLYEWHVFDPASIKAIMALPKDDPRRIKFNLIGTAILFLFYFFGAIIMAFTGVALTAYVIALFNGKKITIQKSLNDALNRLGTITAWALVSATVGIILDMFRGKKGKKSIAQSLVGQALGMAWSILTFFVVPVISQERLGAFGSIKRSGEIMKKTFGEYVGGSVGFGLIVVGMALISFGLGYLLNLIFGMAIGLSIAVPFFIIGIIIINLATLIFQAAVYQFANKKPTGEFSVTVIKASFTKE